MLFLPHTAVPVRVLDQVWRRREELEKVMTPLTNNKGEREMWPERWHEGSANHLPFTISQLQPLQEIFCAQWEDTVLLQIERGCCTPRLHPPLWLHRRKRWEVQAQEVLFSTFKSRKVRSTFLLTQQHVLPWNLICWAFACNTPQENLLHVCQYCRSDARMDWCSPSRH